MYLILRLLVIFVDHCFGDWLVCLTALKRILTGQCGTHEHQNVKFRMSDDVSKCTILRPICFVICLIIIIIVVYCFQFVETCGAGRDIRAEILAHAERVAQDGVYLDFVDLLLYSHMENIKLSIISNIPGELRPVSLVDFLTETGLQSVLDFPVPRKTAQRDWFIMLTNINWCPSHDALSLHHWVPVWKCSQTEVQESRDRLDTAYTKQRRALGDKMASADGEDIQSIMELMRKQMTIHLDLTDVLDRLNQMKDAEGNLLADGWVVRPARGDGNCGLWSLIALARGAPNMADTSDAGTIEEMHAMRATLAADWASVSENPVWHELWNGPLRNMRNNDAEQDEQGHDGHGRLQMKTESVAKKEERLRTVLSNLTAHKKHEKIEKKGTIGEAECAARSEDGARTLPLVVPRGRQNQTPKIVDRNDPDDPNKDDKGVKKVKADKSVVVKRERDEKDQKTSSETSSGKDGKVAVKGEKMKIDKDEKCPATTSQSSHQMQEQKVIATGSQETKAKKEEIPGCGDVTGTFLEFFPSGPQPNCANGGKATQNYERVDFICWLQNEKNIVSENSCKKQLTIWMILNLLIWLVSICLGIFDCLINDDWRY